MKEDTHKTTSDVRMVAFPIPHDFDAVPIPHKEPFLYAAWGKVRLDTNPELATPDFEVNRKIRVCKKLKVVSGYGTVGFASINGRSSYVDMKLYPASTRKGYG